MNKPVSATPAGYNSLTAYLIIDQALKAIAFYEKVFGAVQVLRMERPDGKIGHAELKIGDSKVMLADEHLEIGAKAPAAYGGSPISLYLYIENVDEVAKKAVEAGAKLIRPVENMFYGDRVGAILDPFGHTWYVATHVEDVSIEELKKRASQLSKNQE